MTSAAAQLRTEYDFDDITYTAGAGIDHSWSWHRRISPATHRVAA
jgi:hypothetical protein